MGSNPIVHPKDAHRLTAGHPRIIKVLFEGRVVHTQSQINDFWRS